MGFSIENLALGGSERFPEASAHGRFQPFHNEHLEYIRAAKECCDFLWIGITKFEILAATPLGRPRERPENNPLTYFERISIISETLDECGIARGSFAFVPFPIETPMNLSQFLPTSIPILTTICEDWNREKISLLQSLRYTVHVLWEREPKVMSGSQIREWIVSGDKRWKEEVPHATARAVEQLHLADRLRKLGQTPHS
jgi:nicotinamide mononucleotide adenylyltransferase